VLTDPISGPPGPPGEPVSKPAAIQGDGLSAWFHKNETTVLLGVGGIVVAIALYVRSRGGSAGSAATSSGSTPISYPEGVADTSGTDYGSYASEISEQLQQLQQQLSGINPGGVVQPAPTTPGTTPTSTTTGPGGYSIISDPNSVENDLTHGATNLEYFAPGAAPGATGGEALSLTPGGGWAAGGNPLQSGAGGTVVSETGTPG
jgi:hypothetical protein